MASLSPPAASAQYPQQSPESLYSVSSYQWPASSYYNTNYTAYPGMNSSVANSGAKAEAAMDQAAMVNMAASWASAFSAEYSMGHHNPYSSFLPPVNHHLTSHLADNKYLDHITGRA